MAVLILNVGGSQISLACQRAGKGAPVLIGAKSRAFAGNERSSIRGQKRVIPILTSPIDTATEAAIQTLIANGAQFPCSGDILTNVSTICSVDCTASDMIQGLPGFFQMALTVNEV